MNEGLKSHFLNLYSMVMVDGEVASKERMEIYRIGEDFYGVKPEEFDKIVFSDEIVFYIRKQMRKKYFTSTTLL